MSAKISYSRHALDEDDVQAVVNVLRHSWLTQGPAVGEFEQAIANHVGAKYAVAVSSGTAALHIACLAAGISSGDRAITSANSFVASANCVRYAGGVPEFADIERDTLNLDPAGLRAQAATGPRVKAIIPVHFGGLPCNMAQIADVAASAGATVIEDAAHALGGRYPSGERVGSCAYSDMTVFSFHPVKSITSGEGGMVTTNRQDLYRRLLRLRGHGINKADDPYQHPHHAYQDGKFNRWYYEMQELGFNYRMTDIQAALGLSQFRKIDRFMARRSGLAARYREAFGDGASGIRVGQKNGLGASANHLFVIRIAFGAGARSRTAYMQRLFDRGYITQVHYIPIPLHPYYARLGYTLERLPETARYYNECLSIPLFVGLADSQQREFINAAVECLA
ncbi:MAG: UDP-4-amino-4,6-dideoxy-N-acetyl-beta-L-altrosamine transaminase [Betaproteobacteria bacterium RIFCSPLOWO2_02_FULL_67_26]|nr:MAG: UDP-4-amino-4,6-dideoxy-N-acetyl-beta-L-altrosamine transaminase [Betaproteobacteria bacterium RIFCSPLOWO2_02_FULL_67_26]